MRSEVGLDGCASLMQGDGKTPSSVTMTPSPGPPWQFRISLAQPYVCDEVFDAITPALRALSNKVMMAENVWPAVVPASSLKAHGRPHSKTDAGDGRQSERVYQCIQLSCNGRYDEIQEC